MYTYIHIIYSYSNKTKYLNILNVLDSMAPSSTGALFRVWSDEYFSHSSPQILSETQWLNPTSNFEAEINYLFCSASVHECEYMYL